MSNEIVSVVNTPSNQIVTVDKLASITSSSGASLVGVNDAGGYYDNTTVEGALQEIPSWWVPFDKIQFNTSNTPVATAPWQLQRNQADWCIDFGLLNWTTLQSGQELYFFGKASWAIANWELCQFAWVQGDHILMKKVVADEIITNPRYVIGVATQNIVNWEFWYVTWLGKINNIYTKTPANNDSADWVNWDILYFDNTTWQLTKTAPNAPDRYIQVAAVIKEQTGASENGIIVVRPMFWMRFTELEDVNWTALTVDKQLAVWDNVAWYFDFTEVYGKFWDVAWWDYTEFESDWTMKANWEATTFDDLLWDITWVKTSWPWVTLNSVENKLDFVDTSNLNDYAYFNYQLSHKWKLGTAVSPHIHYEQANDNTPNFMIQYRRQKQWQIKTTAWTNAKLNVNVFTWTTGRLNQIANWYDITPPEWYGQVSDIIQMRLLRDTNNDSELFDDVDTYSWVVWITSMDIHYECDTLWSRSEYVK